MNKVEIPVELVEFSDEGSSDDEQVIRDKMFRKFKNLGRHEGFDSMFEQKYPVYPLYSIKAAKELLRGKLKNQVRKAKSSKQRKKAMFRAVKRLRAGINLRNPGNNSIAGKRSKRRGGEDFRRVKIERKNRPHQPRDAKDNIDYIKEHNPRSEHDEIKERVY